jgi:putative transposase
MRTLDAAYAATPERFVRRAPTPPAVPAAAWINEPKSEEAAH